MLELLVQRDLVLQQHGLAIDLDAREPLAAQALEDVLELALAAAHDRCVDGELGSLGQAEHLIHDLLCALPRNGSAALRTMRVANPRVQEAQVVVDLGDGPDRRARVARRRLLVDRDGGRESIDAIDIGLLHLPEELSGVRTERFDVAPLSLCVERVEGETGLARPGKARDADELIARQLNGDVLEVVLAGTPNRDRLLDGHPTSLIARPAEPAAWVTRRGGRAGTCRWSGESRNNSPALTNASRRRCSRRDHVGTAP